MKKNYLIACTVLTLLAIGALLVLYPRLPNMVPTHWDTHGRVNGMSPRWALAAIGPGAMLALTLLFTVLPALSPARFSVDTFKGTYWRVALIALGMEGYIFAMLLLAALSGAFDLSRAAVAGIALFTALIGNLMGKVHRNYWMGIRTPWTLASARVWLATHRLAGKLMVGTGVLAMAGALAGVPFWICLPFLLAGMIIPVFYSLYLYKRMEREGTLEADAMPEVSSEASPAVAPEASADAPADTAANAPADSADSAETPTHP